MPEPPDLLDALGVAVPPGHNRVASFTNKAAAYYCAQTHAVTHPEYSWYEGLNVAKNRVFGGYDLFVNGQPLDNQQADVTVYPHKLVRQHGPVQEQLWLLDERNLLEVRVTGTSQPVAIQLRGTNVRFQHQQDDLAFFSAQEGDFVLAVAPRDAAASVQRQEQRVVTSGDGFLLAAGRDKAEATALIREGQQHGPALQQARRQRLLAYVRTATYLAAPANDTLTQVLRWLLITTNQLVTHQQGAGIYAGLPWFNEYWGRDEFISLPGAVLVTGQFAIAREILLSFAQYQQLDKESEFYGRIPNIVNPTTLDYHTADGTPRFVVALRDYVQYAGDTAIIPLLYPNVKISIEGALQNWVNENGYLRHADNETWMDARDAHKVAYTPRGSRANDIQALWCEQLRAGAYFAAYMHDAAHEQQWTQLARQVQAHFNRDFRDSRHEYLADRLDHQGQADFTLRPNQLFAFGLLDDPAFARQALRRTWQALVYPWGVATLDQQDPRFHPYHLTPAYPKDAAYHQGTVWPWLNGMAMQRLLEAGQTETAYQLFANATGMALTGDVVGGLSENLDAYPHPGQAWPRQTGAYLQAWSNAEHLRVWYQYFLGIRPDVPGQRLTLAPRLPAAVRQLTYHVAVGPAGRVQATYQADPTPTHTYAFAGLSLDVVVDVLLFAPLTMPVRPGMVLHVQTSAQQLTLRLREEASGRLLTEQTAAPSAARLDEQHQNDAVLAGMPFAAPQPANCFGCRATAFSEYLAARFTHSTLHFPLHCALCFFPYSPGVAGTWWCCAA